MALEKRFYSVPPQFFTADGTTGGVVTIAGEACALFKVKQKIIISATSLPNLNLEIKEIDGEGNIQVGPIGGTLGAPSGNTGISARTDISAYTVALGANIFADEQRRPAIDYAELTRAVYDEEPSVAFRSILVDECGNRFNATNPLPTSATFTGSITIGAVEIKDQDNNYLDVNSNGSLNTWIFDSAGNSLSSTGGSLNVNVTNPASTVRIEDTSGNALNSTSGALNAFITNTSLAVTQSISPWVVSGTVTALQGTSPWLTSRNWTLSNSTDSVNVGNFPSTQAVTQGTSPWVVSGTVTANQGGSWTVAATQSGTWTTDRTWTLSSATDSVTIAGTVSVSGTVAVTQSTSPWVTSRNWTLSSGSDSVSAVQSGTWTVQQGGAPWSVSQSGTWTVRVEDSSGNALNSTSNALNTFITNTSLAVTQSGMWSVGRTWTLSNSTDSIAAVQSGTWNLNNITGTITLPTGAATSANQTNGNQQTQIVQGGNTAAVTAGSALKVDGSAVTQPVSGTVTADVAGLNNFQTSQYTVGASAVQITPTPLNNRSSVALKAVCTTGNAIYIGTTSGVTTSTGFPLYNENSLDMDLTGVNTIYAIASAASQTLCVVELA
jgi:hypothetical protein